MGEASVVRLRTCMACGAQETTNALGMAVHATACRPSPAYMRRRRKGLCVRCGKPSLPYVMCDQHRDESNLKNLLDRGSKFGMFVKTKDDRGRCLYAMGDDNARVGVRGFYNKRWLGGAPRGFFPYVVAYLNQQGRPMTEDAIVEAFTDYRRDRADKGHLESTMSALAPEPSSARPPQ